MVKKKGKGRAKPVPTLMEPDPRNITLFGWVLDVSNSAFLVHIEHSMTVSHLKEEEEASYVCQRRCRSTQTVEGQWLFSTFTRLCSQISHKVAIALKSDLKNEVTKHQFLDEDMLLGVDQLRTIFPHPEPAERTLHIVVGVRAGECVNRSANSKLNYSS